MKIKVFGTVLVILMVLELSFIVMALVVGSDGWSKSPIRVYGHICFGLLMSWILAGFVSFVVRYSPQEDSEVRL